MDLETCFRAAFNLSKDQDIVSLIEAAIDVAALVEPEKLKRRRNSILNSLFRKDSVHSPIVSSDEEENSDDDFCVAVAPPKKKARTLPDDDVLNEPKNRGEELLLPEKIDNAKAVESKGPEKKSSVSVFKKAVEESEKSGKFEATKRKLAELYQQESERKSKRKIGVIDVSEAKLLGQKSRALNSTVRGRLQSRMNRIKK